MKKTYINPVIAILEFETTGALLQNSVPMGGDDDRTDEDFEELSRKRGINGSNESGIWRNMQK